MKLKVSSDAPIISVRKKIVCLEKQFQPATEKQAVYDLVCVPLPSDQLLVFFRDGPKCDVKLRILTFRNVKSL